MLAATKKVKMSGSEKGEQKQTHYFLNKTCNNEVSGSFSRSSLSKQRQRNVKKKFAASLKLFFFAN